MRTWRAAWWPRSFFRRKVGRLLALGGFSASVLLAGLARVEAQDADPPLVLLNGSWFDGTRFQPRERVVIVKGEFADVPPPPGAKTIDLTGKFVIPPFADAHTHLFDGPAGLPWQRKLFLGSGVFYAMNLTAPTSGVLKIRSALRGPENVDVVSAMGGITGPESHPAEIYEANALGYYGYRQQLAHLWEIRQSRKAADDAYYVVSNRADVDAKWRLIQRAKPDVVKVFLRSSEHYAEHWKKWGAGGGIDPKLLPYIVFLARKDGLRTAVAVNTAFDYRQALNAGAALISHMPCYQDASGAGPYYDVNTAPECLLTDQDAKRAARQRMVSVVVATEWENDRAADLVAWEHANIEKLVGAGAPIAIGSDQYGRTYVDGLIAGVRKGFFPPPLILRWATMETAKAIFPDRRVGCLSAGCEASLLVLPQDPRLDIAAIKTIDLKIKEGHILP